MGEITSKIPIDATTHLIEYLLEELSTIEDVTVSFLKETQLCTNDGAITSITLNSFSEEINSNGLFSPLEIHFDGTGADVISIKSGDGIASDINDQYTSQVLSLIYFFF